jgi:hypothetical protein
MSSRPSNKHRQGHAPNNPKAFTSSGVNAEYKAALSVFNDTLLTEAHVLLFPPKPSIVQGENQESQESGSDSVDVNVQQNFQFMYNKCKTACNTILKTEAMPGFLKKMNIGMHKGGVGMGPGHRMNKSASGQPLHRQPSSLSISSSQAKAKARPSSQTPTSQFSLHVPNQQIKSKHNSLRAMPSSSGGIGASIGGASSMKPFPLIPAATSGCSSSSSNNISNINISSLAGTTGAGRRRCTTPPPPLKNSTDVTANSAPPKSALKFLEALNNRGVGATASLSNGGGSLSNKGGGGGEKRKKEALPSSGKKRKRQAVAKEMIDREEEEEEFQEENEDSSNDHNINSGIGRDSEGGGSGEGSSDSDASVSSVEAPSNNDGKSRRSTRTRGKNPPPASPSNNDGKSRRSTRTRTRTDALTYEPESKPEDEPIHATKQKSPQAKAKSQKPSPSPSPPSSQKRSMRQKKVNAPKEASGEKFGVGDDILVYHEPDDKWYEAIVSNVNYFLEKEQKQQDGDGNASAASGDNADKTPTRSSRRSGRNRNKNTGGNGEGGKLEIASYDVEYDNGEAAENVLPLIVMNRYLDS